MSFYFGCYLEELLLTIHKIMPMTNTTANTPTQTPALKIPPITAQPGKIGIRATNTNAQKNRVNDFDMATILR
jgi:hypothetical protein